MLEHGGALRAAAARHGIPFDDWLDLSTGINPQGWPVPAVPAPVWRRLPEPGDGLETVAADYYGSPNPLPVAGSQAAIQALPLLREPGRAGVLALSYAEHAHAWRRAGHELEQLDVAMLAAAIERLDVLVLVNPNNPTGLRFDPATLLDWRARLAARGGWLVVDEAFVDATPESSLAAHVGQPGLIVLRSLGKFFGLAGARVGFVLGESVLLERLADRLGPWAVSGPSRWVAARALADRDWQDRTRIALDHGCRRRKPGSGRMPWRGGAFWSGASPTRRGCGSACPERNRPGGGWNWLWPECVPNGCGNSEQLHSSYPQRH